MAPGRVVAVDAGALTAAVRDAEARTAAEIVVVVRPRSGTYRDVAYAFGFGLAVVTLTALLYLPTEFPLWMFGLDVVVAFAVGALLVALSPGLTRLLTSKKRLDDQVTTAAHAAFFEKGVSRTSGRWGVLVYVSLLEGHARVVPDVGIEPHFSEADAKEALANAVAAIEEGAQDASVLPVGLLALGVVLGERLPRGEDDVNELGDAADAVPA